MIKNIYCDESCHLENDSIDYMVLGGISCSDHMKVEVFQRLKDIRKEHSITSAEMKWTKVSSAKLDAYKDIINYFFDKDELSFRAIIINKRQLSHAEHFQTHDDFYYKMYFLLLDWFLQPQIQCAIYLDIKDTQGVDKIRHLKKILSNANHDYQQQMVKRIQEVRSHEIVLMQIVDVLVGAIGYVNRYPNGGKSAAKNKICELIKERSGASLIRSTVRGAQKFNIFCWEGKDGPT